MGRSQETFKKKEVRSKKEKKRKDKEKRRLERKENDKSSGLDDMIAYVDAYGNITDTPPAPEKKEDVNAEDIVLGVPKKEISEDDNIRVGVIKYFNQEKGYGFIKEQGNVNNIFVHVNNLLEEVQENDKVKFEVEKGDRGLIAVNVRLDK